MQEGESDYFWNDYSDQLFGTEKVGEKWVEDWIHG